MGVDGDQEGPAQPIQAVDEECGELALLGVLEEPPAFRPLVQRNGARYAVVGLEAKSFLPQQQAWDILGAGGWISCSWKLPEGRIERCQASGVCALAAVDMRSTSSAAQLFMTADRFIDLQVFLGLGAKTSEMSRNTHVLPPSG